MSMFDPAKQTQGGGLFHDVDGLVVSSRCIQFDFPDSNKNGVFKPGTKNVPGIEIKLQAGELERSEFYGIGTALQSVVKAAPDGKCFVALPGKEMPEGLNKGTKAAKLLTELANIKFPKLGELVNGNGGKGDFTVLEGHVFHWKRRKDVFKDSDGKDAEMEILYPTAYVGEGSAKPSKSKSTTSKKSAAVEESDDDDFNVEVQLSALITYALDEADEKTLSRVAVQRAVTAQMKEDEETWTKERKSEVQKLLLSDRWLGSQEGWSFDKKNLTLNE